MHDPYRIFLSHTSSDLPIADQIQRVLNDGFRGQVEIYLAAKGILSGDDWKVEVKNNLDKNDAIISLISKEAILSPWIYVEWSHYWMCDKRYYVLKTADASMDKIFAPMLYRQITHLEDYESVRKLIEAIARDANIKDPTPYKAVDALLEGVRKGETEKAELLYGQYRRSLADLPASDEKKRSVAHFFYYKNEFDLYERIVMSMRDDALKLDEIAEIIRSSHMPHEQELRIIENITGTINSAEKLANVAIELVRSGSVDAKIIHRLIESMAQRNQAELRRFGIYLIEQHLEDSTALKQLVARMTNMAELRKIGEAMLESGKADNSNFVEIIGLFNNDRELLKLADRLISRRAQTTEVVDAIRDQLIKKGGTYLKQFEILLNAID